MDVANLDLCRDLFELSGWGQSETHLTYYDGSLDETEPWDRGADNRKNIPAYDLGYLLRKLKEYEVVVSSADDRWQAWHYKGYGRSVQFADTPEDAACKLAIELFKQGVLKGE